MTERAQPSTDGDGPVRMSPATRKGYTNRRVDNFTDVPNLDFSVLASHLAEVVHDISFDRYIRDMNKIFFNRAMSTQDILYQRLGADETRQLRGFFETVASDQAAAVDPLIERVYRSILKDGGDRVVLAYLGLNLRNAFQDILQPFVVTAFGDIRARDLSATLGTMVKDLTKSMLPGHTFELEHRAFALAKSGELRLRMNHVNQQMKDVLLGLKETPSALEKVRQASFILLDYTDRWVSTVVWMSKYREALANGRNDKNAVMDADAAVRKAMPAHLLAEMPALLRNRVTVGVIANFLGYHNTLFNATKGKYNELARQWRDASTPREYMSAGMGTAWVAARIMAGLTIAYTLGDYVVGRGKEEDEKWSEWWIRKTLAAPGNMVAFTPDVTVPLIDWTVTGEVKQTNPRTAPAFAFFQHVKQTGGRLMSNSRSDQQKFWDLVEAGLWAAKLPARQVRLTGEYATRLATRTEQETDKGARHVAGGFIYGRRRKQPENPFTDDSLMGILDAFNFDE